MIILMANIVSGFILTNKLMVDIVSDFILMNTLSIYFVAAISVLIFNFRDK